MTASSGKYKVLSDTGSVIIDADGFYINENNTMVFYHENIRTDEQVEKKVPRILNNVAAFRIDQWKSVYQVDSELEN